VIISFGQDKRESKLAKHGLDLPDGGFVLRGTVFELPDDRSDYGENRWIAIGMLRALTVVCVFAEYEDEFRMISLRRAEPHERKTYEQHLARHHG